MNFITKLSRKAKGYDVIWVIMDRLTKNAHFLAIRESSSAKKLVDMHTHEIVTHHGVLVSIGTDLDVWFNSRFW